ncbi:MAG: signal peptidase I [Opitutales bacterium]|nr:signal peptidase I [Opitutales bacterium]
MSFYYRRKLRKIGKALLEGSEKVYLYRGDVLSKASLNEQLELAEKVRVAARDRTMEVTQVETLLNRLHEVLVRNGGKVYPVTSGTDWTEMVVMAAIVAGAIRSFLLQPFKIPTNSMWPTYNGMTAEVRAADEPVPSLAQQVLDKVQWTWTSVIPAEATGEVGIPIVINRYGNNQVEYALRSRQRTLDDGIFGSGIWKGAADKYEIQVGGTLQGVLVPADFGFETVLLKTFFPQEAKLKLPRQDQDRWRVVFANASREGRIKSGPFGPVLMTGKQTTAGQTMLNFDILTGDMLFVDRMSYNFVDPSRGDTFVFRTNNIRGLDDQYGQPSQNYYVKRLAGVPGQKLRVGEKGELFVDGKVVTSPEPMALNSQRAMDKGYYGYLPEAGGDRYAIPLQQEYTVTSGHYFALGDNSSNSFDSRGWGEVPAKDVVGKPLFILHPVTSHWGPAK